MGQEIRVERFNVLIPANSNSSAIECAIAPITEEMNRTPLIVNADTWKVNVEAKRIEVDEKVELCRQEVGNPKFRPNATADCVEVFLKQRGLPLGRLTTRGAQSMSKDVIEVFAQIGDKLAPLVLDARTAMAEKSQLEKWEPYARAGYVQATWNSLGTPMGRYTSAGPSVQNRIVPIRETIEAPTNWKFMSWDLGAAEYVTWASLSGDPVLGAIFKAGRDVHSEMIEMLQAAIPDLDLHGAEPRKFGKTCNFALCYLMQDWAFSNKLGVSKTEAGKIIQFYKEQAKVAVKYIQEILGEARRTGWVKTHFGRMRHIPILKAARAAELHEAEKTAWHHVNCGTTAEVVKVKTIRAIKALESAGLYPLKVKMALQMHDEIILQVADEDVAQVQAIVDEAFARPIAEFLPYKVTTKTGQTWKDVSK